MAATSKDEFVDLYEVLELATDTDAETIRKRLNELYLEAQQNLDHRNVKKRLQYQQMYEIYLPQARHLLLDPRRRGEYDRYLEAYRTGNKVAPSEQAEHESAAPIGEMSKVDEPPLPGMAEVEVDPEVVAAERENLWAKWKEGLQLVEEETTAPTSAAATAPAATAPAATATESVTEAPAAADAPSTPATPSLPPFARRSAPPPRPNAAAPGTRPAPPPPRTPGSPPPSRPTPPAPRTPKAGRTPSIAGVGAVDSAEELEKQRELERQREHERQRYVIIADASQNTGIVWGAIYGCVIFLVGCIGLFFLINSLKTYPLGLSSGMFSGICLVLLLAAAAFGGSFGRRKAQARKEAELNALSTEEVMRLYRS